MKTLLIILSGTIYRTLAFVPLTNTPFQLTCDYSGQEFFNNFEFCTDKDPTNGHVKYVGFETANKDGLVGLISDYQTDPAIPPPVFIGVDAKTPSTPQGRNSVRLSSVQTFNHALVIADILHMPDQICGVWPAYWMLGSSAQWPLAGEIDILENVNVADTNHYTLHTSPGITAMNHTSDQQKGILSTADCDVNAPGQPQNVGCSVTDAPDVPSYGTKFNENGGGVFATLIDSDGINIWFFPRDKIPADIDAGSPVPPPTSLNAPASNNTWGVPNARFMGQGNDFDKHFKDMKIIINTSLCGDWAGKVWNTTPECSKRTTTCEEWVTKSPGAFADAYWAIQSIKVFEKGDMDWTAPYPPGSTSSATSSPSP